MIPIMILSWVAATAGIYMLLFTIANIVYLRYISKASVEDFNSKPFVSVLIPARNEAERIGPAIEGLMRQTYARFEVIVLDDNSEDDTGSLVNSLIKDDSRFTCIRGRELPPEWKGKPFAMQQLVEKSKGEILLFLDADMFPEPELIDWTVNRMLSNKVDFLSGYARHTTPEKAEYLLFPVMYLATSFLLPLWLFRRSKSYVFSHAIGQYFCVNSSVMKEVDGFRPVKNKINEDIQMARYLKGKGYSQVFIDAKKYISGNMYDSMDHARMGVMRVLYEYFDNLVYPFIFMGAVMLLFLLMPLVLAPLALYTGHPSALPLFLNIGLVLLAWLLTMLDRKLPWYTAFFYPVHFAWILRLSVRSIVLSKRGLGYIWKGRTVL